MLKPIVEIYKNENENEMDQMSFKKHLISPTSRKDALKIFLKKKLGFFQS